MIDYRERYEDLMVKLSFYVFMASSAYIFLKRFYVNEIINFVIWVICNAFIYMHSGLHEVMLLLKVTPADLLINFDCCPKEIASPIVNSLISL